MRNWNMLNVKLEHFEWAHCRYTNKMNRLTDRRKNEHTSLRIFCCCAKNCTYFAEKSSKKFQVWLLEMSSSFLRIFQHAEKTFSAVNAESYKANFQHLKKLVDKLVLSDLNVNLPTEKFHDQEDKAPCTFINLYESKLFSMSVFILNDSYKMPLHDHPRMYGLLKVISGKLKIESYSRIPSNKPGEIIVKAENVKIISESSEAAMLLPDCGNYHELTALDGRPAAFYDILSPPYSEQNDSSEDARHCSFYRKLMVDNSGSNPVMRLIKIPCPHHYFCDSFSYEQPDFMR